jgi:DNA-binding response OmpR family regulator
LFLYHGDGVVRVLVVDDDETIRELLQSYLQRTPLE